MGSGLGEGSGVAALEVKGTLSHPPTLQYFIQLILCLNSQGLTLSHWAVSNLQQGPPVS